MSLRADPISMRLGRGGCMHGFMLSLLGSSRSAASQLLTWAAAASHSTATCLLGTRQMLGTALRVTEVGQILI